MSRIILHHLDKSRSHRILWFLEELEVDYELVTHARNAQGRAPDSLKQVHPLGKAPAVVFEDQVLVESGAILETLAERLAEGRMAVERSDAAFSEYRFMMHYPEGSVMTPLLVKLLMNRVRTAPLPFFIKPIARRVTNSLDERYTDGELAAHASFLDDWFKDREFACAGRLTAADVQLSFPAYALVQRADADAPHLKAWIDRISERPAFQRAIEKGGPVL